MCVALEGCCDEAATIFMFWGLVQRSRGYGYSHVLLLIWYFILLLTHNTSTSRHISSSSSLCLRASMYLSSVQFSAVSQSCPTLFDPMDYSTPGFPVNHQFPEFTQINVHWVSDAMQPSHPLSSPSPPTFNLSQHQGLFKWLSSLHQVAKVLVFQLQLSELSFISPSNEHSGLISFRMDWLDLLAAQGTL